MPGQLHIKKESSVPMAKNPKKKKAAASPGMRGPTHRTDTRAMRVVLNQIQDDWLVRNLEERDYGIDLQLEIFAKDRPTGNFVFIQLKGTEAEFDELEEVKFQIPVSTILYSQLFSAPFFLFRTSVASKRTRFIWLQKYAATVLSRKKGWQKQGTVSVSMPPENDIQNNVKKFLEIVREPSMQAAGVEFMRVENTLQLHAPNVITGEFAVAISLAKEAQKLLGMTLFLRDYVNAVNEEAITKLAFLPDIFSKIGSTLKITGEQIIEIIEALEALDEIKTSFLITPEVHDFAVEMGAYKPY